MKELILTGAYKLYIEEPYSLAQFKSSTQAVRLFLWNKYKSQPKDKQFSTSDQRLEWPRNQKNSLILTLSPPHPNFKATMSAEDVFEGAVGIDLGTTYSSVMLLWRMSNLFDLIR